MAMKRVKVRIDTGVVCEQYVYSVPEKCDIRTTKPRKPRFADEAERKEHRRRIAEREHRRKFMENFHAGDLYSTLTFDDEHELHDFKEARRIRDNYFRRLQRACPDAVIFIYMGRGKSTSRIHFHMVTKGIPEDTIREKWGMGDIDRIEELRKECWYEDEPGKWVNHGPDFTALANYLFGHWTEEQGGHRYKCTRNARIPKVEKSNIKEVKRDYCEKHPPRAPKGYMLVEVQGNKYGYWWFKYVKKPMPKPVGRPRKDRVELKS